MAIGRLRIYYRGGVITGAAFMPRKRKEKAVPDPNQPQQPNAPQQQAQQGQPPQQPGQGQPQQGAPQLTAEHQQALAAAGIDWGKIQNLPWGQIFALIQILLQALQSKQPTP